MNAVFPSLVADFLSKVANEMITLETTKGRTKSCSILKEKFTRKRDEHGQLFWCRVGWVLYRFVDEKSCEKSKNHSEQQQHKQNIRFEPLGKRRFGVEQHSLDFAKLWTWCAYYQRKARTEKRFELLASIKYVQIIYSSYVQIIIKSDNMLRAGDCSRVNTMPRRVLYIAT